MADNYGCPLGDALQLALWHEREENSSLVFTVPEGSGYGFLQLIRIDEGKAAFRTDLFLYEPLRPISFHLFPDDTRSFLFFFDAEHDHKIQCCLPDSTGRGSLEEIPAGHLVRLVGFSYKESTFRSYLSMRYSEDTGRIACLMEGIPFSIETEYALDLFGKIGKVTSKGPSAIRQISDAMDMFLFYLTNNTHELCTSCSLCSKYHSEDRMGLCAVASYLLKYPEESPSVEKLARLACMSPTKLKNLFKQVYGKTLYGYLRSVRMDFAATHLKEGLSVTEVAISVGYQSVNRFSEAFRDAFGKYPSKIKKESQNKKLQ